MAISKKSFVNLDLQGNALVNPTIGLNSDMTKAGSFQYNSVDNRLEYFNGSTIETVANLGDVTGALDFQGGYDAATNTPDLTNPVSGAIKKGYYWVVTAAGTFFGEPLAIGDSLFAQVDNPASLGDWVIVQGNLDLATDTVAGISRLATQAEVDAGTEGGAVVITPATLQGKIDAQITPEINNKLPLAGGTMSGNIEMDGNYINGASYLVSNIAQINDTQTTNLSAYNGSEILLNSNLDASNSKTIVNLPTPTNGGDATNKTYVDTAASTAESNANTYTDTQIASKTYNQLISNTDWTLNDGVYSFEVVHGLEGFPVISMLEATSGNYCELLSQYVTNGTTKILSNILPTDTIIVTFVNTLNN